MHVSHNQARRDLVCQLTKAPLLTPMTNNISISSPVPTPCQREGAPNDIAPSSDLPVYYNHLPFNSPSPRLARQLQKEVQSANPSDFTEDQKVTMQYLK